MPTIEFTPIPPDVYRSAEPDADTVRPASSGGYAVFTVPDITANQEHLIAASGTPPHVR
ncbi:hypothetical protein [Nocardia sp. alder85J]|uniref:hypothetical protein n=1 Tax=Nocardia sp. alder85J TaxID=2862949 RepID=UPI001CD71E5C|nr:hypothetical protein [Nocardia sp. alder85J]MCX4094522.1 hypothetical protein [Nocardia sp. alder85J]